MQYVSDNYMLFAGKTLERFYHDLAMQNGRYTRIGNWWDKKGGNEIDMVALNEFERIGVIAEIKRRIYVLFGLYKIIPLAGRL